MGWITRMGWREGARVHPPRKVGRIDNARGVNRRWQLDVDDYGFADVNVRTGDLDGSGEAPGVQLEFEHEYSKGICALAMSANEAELLARALHKAAAIITPAMRLRGRRRKLREVAPSLQPEIQRPVAEHVELTPEQATELLDILENIPEPTGQMRDLMDQLRIPF